jgi:hypothetical protein
MSYKENVNNLYPVSKCYYSVGLSGLALINFVIILWLIYMKSKVLSIGELIRSKMTMIYLMIGILDFCKSSLTPYYLFPEMFYCNMFFVDA